MCKKFNVLLNNPQKETFEALKKQFESKQGINLIPVENSLKKRMQEIRPEIAILDLDHKEKEVFDLCDQVMHEKLFTNTKVILTATDAGPSLKARGYRAGAIDFITKPFCDEELSTKIQLFLQIPGNHSKQVSTALVQNTQFIEAAYKVKHYLNRILFIKAEAPYCNVVYQNDNNSKSVDEMSFRSSISQIEMAVANKGLVRVHRSYLVSIKKVFGVKRKNCREFSILFNLKGRGMVNIPVGRSYVSEVKKNLPELLNFT